MNYCSVCGSQFEKYTRFDVAGMYLNEEFATTNLYCVCPHCWSQPRQRLVCDWLDKNMPSGTKTCLLAGADAHAKRYFQRKGIQPITLDLTNGWFQRANIVADLEDVPLDDESWNLIISVHVLEHISDFEKALNELHRILKKTGTMLIVVPENAKPKTSEGRNLSPQERFERFGQIDHFRIFGRDFENILKAHGFNVEIIDKGTAAPMQHDAEKLYICTRSD